MKGVINEEKGGAMCGGVVSKSLFDSDPMAYMMCYYLEDKYFEKYKAEKDAKKRHKIFEKYAHSAI